MFYYEFRNVIRLCVITVLICLLYSSSYAGFPEFKCYQIAKIGRSMGQTSLVDIDKDGDADDRTAYGAGQGENLESGREAIPVAPQADACLEYPSLDQNLDGNKHVKQP
jgi:hypothetical protein